MKKHIERNYAFYLAALILSLMAFKKCSGQKVKMAIKGEWVQIAPAKCIDDSLWLYQEAECVIYEGNYEQTGLADLKMGEEYILATPYKRERFVADRKRLFWSVSDSR